MPWYDYLAKDAYQRWFEKPRFEEATEPKETWLTKAYETFRKGAEVAQRAMVEPEPIERFREVEREMQPAAPERALVIPSAEEVRAGAQAAAGRLRERVEPLRPEFLAATATPAEMRRAKGQVPQVVGAGFPYEPEMQAARGRLTESLRQGHPEWSEEQLHFAVTSAIDPGEGFMPMAAWGLAMRPAMAAMAIAGGRAAAPVGRAAIAAGERVIPSARRVMTEEVGGLKPRPKPLWEPEAMRAVKPKPAAQAFREATERPLEEALELAGMGRAEALEAPGLPRAGIRAPGRAGAPPPPRKPPVAEAVPPIGAEDPVAKLTELIRAAKPVRAETEAMKHTARQRQAAQLREIWAKYPGPEGLRRAKGALRGELPTAKFEPPRLKMTPDDIYELHARAARADIQEFQKLNLKEALEKVLRGEQPTWGEISRLESVFGRELGKALESQMPLGKRAWREFWELTGLPRAVQTAFDMSFHLRQGILLTPRHLKEAGQAFKQAGRALKEPNARERVAYWEQMKTAGEIPDNTFIAKFGEAAAFQERAEPFITRWADRIPGVRISERVFASGGNEMRGQLARTLKQTWEKRLGRSMTSEEGRWVGRLVNYGTGRGPLPDNLRQVLGGIFYAPGFRSSKPAYVSLLLNPQTPAFVRGMVAQELVTFIGAGVATLTVLDVSGLAEVELDPRSSDWGKIRIGEMRMDFWGGNQQIARSVAQLITGQRKTLSTGDIMGITRREVPLKYLEMGLSPQASIGLDIYRGETFLGEPLKPEMQSARGQFWNRMAPMGIQDIVEAVKTEKFIGAIAAPFAFLGVGVYAPDLLGAKVNELCRQYDPEGRRKAEMAPVEFKRLADEHPDLAEAYEKQIAQASERGAEWAEFKEAQDEADTQFESDLIAALADPQGRTWQDISDGIGDYFRDRAIRNNQQYADLERDPRGELGRKIDAYYAIELPRFATEEQRNAFFNERGAMLEADPELASAILDNQVLRFSDPDVRLFIRLRWEAQQIADEYYSIPVKIGMSAEEQDRAARTVEIAQDIATQQGIPFMVALFDMNLTTDEETEALIYYNLPDNPDRKLYRYDYPGKWQRFKAFYSEILVEVEPEMAMAGVP